MECEVWGRSSHALTLREAIKFMLMCRRSNYMHSSAITHVIQSHTTSVLRVEKTYLQTQIYNSITRGGPTRGGLRPEARSRLTILLRGSRAHIPAPRRATCGGGRGAARVRAPRLGQETFAWEFYKYVPFQPKTQW